VLYSYGVTLRSSIILALLVVSSVALGKPVPERFEHAELPDVTRTQDTLGGRSGVIDANLDGVKGPLVVVNPTAIFVGGKAIIRMKNGAVDAIDKEADRAGRFLPRLVATVPAIPSSDPTVKATVMVGIDRSLSYSVVSEVIYSLKKAHSSVHLLVHAGGSVQAVPVVLGDMLKDDLGMVIVATKSEVLVFSRSGKEGSMAKPLARIAIDDNKGDVGRSDAAMKVRTLLAKIEKKWSAKAKKKVAFGKTIALVADETTTMQFVADLMVAARAHFPNLTLVVTSE
jgi:biopolymer transport protein ExbD